MIWYKRYGCRQHSGREGSSTKRLVLQEEKHGWAKGKTEVRVDGRARPRVCFASCLFDCLLGFKGASTTEVFCYLEGTIRGRAEWRSGAGTGQKIGIKAWGHGGNDGRDVGHARA